MELFCIFLVLLPHSNTPRKSNHHHYWLKSRTSCLLCKFTDQLFSDLYYSFEWVRYAENGHIQYMTQFKQPNSCSLIFLKPCKMGCLLLITSSEGKLASTILTTKSLFWATFPNSVDFSFNQLLLCIYSTLKIFIHSR